MLLAGPIELSPEDTRNLLLALAGVLLVAGGLLGVVVWLGCRWARRAARGDRRATGWWAVLTALECFPAAWLTLQQLQRSATKGIGYAWLVTGVVVAFQASFYVRGRRSAQEAAPSQE